MSDKTISYQNASIHYRVHGSGKPVVLIHGFGEDGRIWEKQVEFLQDRFQLIVPDLPGSGRSDLIPDMSIEGMAEVIKLIIDVENFTQKEPRFPLQGAEGVEGAGTTLLGHSMGGYITLAFAEKHPAYLKSFGLIHSSAFADGEEKKAARRKSIEFIEKNGAYEFLKSAIPGLFLMGQDGSNLSDQSKPGASFSNRGLTALSRPDPDPVADLIEKGRAFSPEALTRYYQAMIDRPDRSAVLKTFPGPVLFIIGRHDAAVPFDQSMKQCYLPVQSHIHILRESAHMGMLEQTRLLNNILFGFLR